MRRKIFVGVWLCLLSAFASISGQAQTIWSQDSSYGDLFDPSIVQISKANCPAGTQLTRLEVWPSQNVIHTLINESSSAGVLFAHGPTAPGASCQPPVAADPDCQPYSIGTRLAFTDGATFVDLVGHFPAAEVAVPAKTNVNLSSVDYSYPGFTEPIVITDPAALAKLQGARFVAVLLTHDPLSSIAISVQGINSYSTDGGLALKLTKKATCK